VAIVVMRENERTNMLRWIREMLRSRREKHQDERRDRVLSDIRDLLEQGKRHAAELMYLWLWRQYKGRCRKRRRVLKRRGVRGLSRQSTDPVLRRLVKRKLAVQDMAAEIFRPYREQRNAEGDRRTEADAEGARAVEVGVQGHGRRCDSDRPGAEAPQEPEIET